MWALVMQSSPARKKGYAPKSFVGSFCQPFAQPSTALHPFCPAHWGRLACVFANDDAGADIRLAALAALSWPRRSWRSLMGLPHFTNWLNCKFMRCPVGIPPPPLHAPLSASNQSIVAKTNTAICDQDDAGSLSFLIASAWRSFRFHFHFPSFVFVLALVRFIFIIPPSPPPFFALPIVMGIMEKIVLHLNNNTRT